MSKKSRRQRRLNLPPEAYNAPAATAVRPAAGPADQAAAPSKDAREAPQRRATSSAPAPIDWKAEYGDVLGDLKRTGILAAIIMAVMVGLSFIIR